MEMLNIMKEKFIKEGYFNNGAISGKCINQNNREELLKLIEDGIVEKRNCILESYQLSDKVRRELILKYDLKSLWRKN